ncbi:glycosyltransferase family 2 protein [Algoriphagus faecimaris]|uniref:glycosyltransferase family 2 protein n=1 Tax=Algoriphagus faecimaris TaxID=686796 RepID=UPI003B84AC8E
MSVVVPCYNNSKNLEETLQSISSQSFQEWECIIVDDGSEDDSVKISDSFQLIDQRFKSLRRPDHLPKGANSCRNFGVSNARAELLLFLDADDLIAPNCLEHRVNKSRDAAELAVFKTVCFVDTIEDTTPFYSKSVIGIEKEKLLDLFLGYQIPWHTSSVVWKKSFFNRIGGFDEGLLRFQDVEIHIRALAEKDSTIFIDDHSLPTSFYRKSAFHTKIDLDKRVFILNQGIIFLEKIKVILGCDGLSKTYSLFLYLMFRFEEVIDRRQLKLIKGIYFSDCKNLQLPFSVSLMIFLHEKVLKRPRRSRKLLAFGIYKFHLAINKQ